MNAYDVLFWSILLIVLTLLAYKYKESNVIARGIATVAKSFFEITLLPLFAMLTTNHAKRIIVTSSLCSHMVAPKNKDLDETIIKKLYEVNESLHLTEHTTEAVLYPAALHELIWGDVLKVDQIASGSVSAETLVGFIPKWLRYGSSDDMKRDIERVMQISGRLSLA